MAWQLLISERGRPLGGEEVDLVRIAMTSLLMSWILGSPLHARDMSTDSCGPERWVLIWKGGHYRPHYSVDSLIPYVAVVDERGRPTSWFATGAIILEGQAANGAPLNWTKETPSAVGDDWRAFLDTVFTPGGMTARLDSVVGMVSEALGPRTRPFEIAIMIPYPDVRGGIFSFAGKKFDLGTLPGRLGAVDAYVREVMRQFRGAHYSHLRLAGFYWLNEAIRPEDLRVMQQFAQEVQDHRLQLLWVPDFFDFTHKHWTDVWALGFDRVFVQPNYFVDTIVHKSRLDSAIDLAIANRVGMEIEVDKRLFLNPEYAQRLEPYLVALDSAPALRAGPLALYEGSGALPKLARTSDSTLRRLYSHLASTFRVPDSATTCR